MRKLRPLFILLAMMMTVAGASAGPVALAQESTPDAPPVEESGGTIEVHARLCDEVPTDVSWFDACHDSPIGGQVVTAMNPDTREVIEGTTDAAGNVLLTVPSGEYEIIGIPGEFVEESFIYCSTADAGVEVAYPVAIGADQPSVICDYYAVPANLQGEQDVTVHVNLCTAPGCTELPEAIEPAEGVEVTLLGYDTGVTLGTCVITGGTCTIPLDVLPDMVNVDMNPETLPEGYTADTAGAPFEVTPESPEIRILLYPVDGFPPEDGTPPVDSEPSPLPIPLALELPASLYAATCEDLESATSAEPLSDLTVVDGVPGGAGEPLQAASGYTEMPMTMVEFMQGEYAIAVLDEGQNVIACGDVGGVQDENGALGFGLAPVDDSGAAGVAYLAPRGAEGEATGITVFLVPEGLIPEEDPAIQPESTPLG